MEKVIKNENDVLKLMDIANRTGKILIANGAEVFRVEDTMERICHSYYGLDGVEVFAITNSIFLTLTYKNKPYSTVVRDKNPSLRLDKIDFANRFSRKFCNENMTMEEAENILDRIEGIKGYPIPTRSLAAGITSAFFSIMFGGNFIDFIAAFVVGFLVYAILAIPPKFMVPIFITDMMSGFLSAGLAALIMFLNLGNNIDMVIIGALMPYVPGIAITNATRDILAGDYLSGVMTATKAIFTAIAIAFGVGIVLAVYFGG